MWKNTDSAQLEVLSQPLPGETYANTKNRSEDSQLAERYLNSGFSEGKV
jgi:hypothetical protein